MTQVALPKYHNPFNPGQDVPCVRNPDLFTASPGRTTFRRQPTDQENRAIQICDTCPALNQCRGWALQHALDEEIVMGGMTGYQRRFHHRSTSPGPPCPQGHPVESMYRRADGHRICRQCQRDRERRNRERRQRSRQGA